MPCFKGLAVSIHTRDGPLPEYSIQKQSRASRISAYIAVPPPKFTEGSSIPEQANFAISITLLTPGGTVPYSKPSPTEDDPFPNGKIVGGLPGLLRDKNNNGVIGPYIPLTSSPNETVAAYIHFDGRAKEEVATLLRRGEETWVNSRWVSVPESEGGGLAEREFLFREVGLERWLNGLDLEGETKDVAARIERRKQRLEKKRRKRLDIKPESDDEDEPSSSKRTHALGRNGVLRYGENSEAPIESLSGDENMAFSSDTDSDDEMPASEAAGQIKVSLFRVLASGEIKRGEYSPQFDAHDDDEGSQQNGDGADADVDHTTTFAKPKTLDPKSISTQTVTGIDPTDKPFATFIFLYRGRKQLQKMGILRAPEPAEQRPVTAKRKSKLMDFSSLGPLKSKGTVGFAGYRDPTTASLAGKTKADDEMDSDPDDEDMRPLRPSNGGVAKTQQELDEEATGTLTAEELSRRGELAEGVKKIQLKRQHSFEPPPTNHKASIGSVASDTTLYASADATGLPIPSSEKKSSLPTSSLSSVADNATPSAQEPRTTSSSSKLDNFDTIGSPFKKQRASIPNDSLANISRFAPTAPMGMGQFSSDSEVAPDVKPEENVSSVGIGGGSGGNTPKHSNGNIDHKERLDEL